MVGGLDKCELYAVVRIAAPVEAIADVFGSCEATVKYQFGDGLLPQSANLFKKFHTVVVKGSGLAPISLLFKPTTFNLSPMIEAKVTHFSCRIDSIYDK